MTDIQKIKKHIQKVYKAYARPLVIGYSGGKDSTAVLQIIWEAIEELPFEELTQDIHVISTDTLVETPYVIDYVSNALKTIEKSARSKNLPIYAHRLTPLYKNSFWVNLIGKGYPAPTQSFRWCTERLKIEPVNRFIAESVDKWGEATIVLGARKSESASRSQVLAKKVRDQLGLSKHPSLSAAFVFTPIEEMTTDEVWTYLLTHKCPWGGNNRDLSAMYQNASGGECPMVVDQSTPSCGNSRFGCWTCTLVQKDTTMENLVDGGEEWMAPLLEFRDMLSETQKPENKSEYRSHKRRNGRVSFIRDTERLSHGPYKLKYRREFLRRLLEIQKEIRAEGPNPEMTLIAPEELELIRKFWREEEWVDSVAEICREVEGDAYPLEMIAAGVFNRDDFDLLAQLCEAEDLPVDLPARLIDQEQRMQGMSRRSGILNKIDSIFKEDWFTDDEMQEMKRRSDAV